MSRRGPVLISIGAGVALGLWMARRRAGAAPGASSPGTMGGADPLTRRLASAFAEGRAAARVREAELRTAFGMDPAS